MNERQAVFETSKIIPWAMDPKTTQLLASPERRQVGSLARAHFVLGAITALTALIGARWIQLGLHRVEDQTRPLPAVVAAVELNHRPPDPELFGLVTIVLGAIVVTLALVHGLALVMIGMCLRRLRWRRPCIVFACFNATYFPLGTALSAWSLWVLFQPNVRELFQSVQPRRISP